MSAAPAMRLAAKVALTLAAVMGSSMVLRRSRVPMASVSTRRSLPWIRTVTRPSAARSSAVISASSDPPSAVPAKAEASPR